MAQNFSTSSPDDLAEVLRRIPPETALIRVDGHAFAGKTTLAKVLASSLRVQCISIDDFIRTDMLGTKVVPKVDKDRLHREIEEALQNGVVIVEGVCLEDLVPAGMFGPEFRIYVKRDLGPGFERVVEQNRRELGTDLYHVRYRPEIIADLKVSTRP